MAHKSKSKIEVEANKTKSKIEVEEDIEYAEGWGEEFGKYRHLDLDAEHLEEESILTEYDPDDFISAAFVSENSSLPVDLFEFEYSYGYDCHKFFNLCACDENVVCWAAGSVVTFYDTVTKQTWFQRSTTGGTVGNIAAHREEPNYRIAIAEARESEMEPVIVLYTWPQMTMDAVLREGTENAYSIMDFSPDGELLASIGREPDFNITIWNWKRHKITLRTSAFTYGVNNVMFSPYCPGQLTTSGLAHIKFWKMAQTFTGLKLKGELGRFGKTEICDVLGVFPMPDEKVLSGCEWGNILVWEANLVKLEVTKRGRKVCHKGPIVQFMLSDARDEVTTIAEDGCIRAWYWDTVEQADPPEDDLYVELNPVAETCVPGCRIMCLKRKEGMFWFAQDGNGGLWTVDLELDKIQCNHTKLFTCHAGPVIGIVAMRTHHVLITAGEDGAIMAYNLETNKLLARYIFPAAVSCMLYLPVEIDKTSQTIMFGFADGMMRSLFIQCERLLELKTMIEIRVQSTLSVHSEDSLHSDVIDMISWLKPHHKKLSQITINASHTLLVTCGEDSTIFMYLLVMDEGAHFSLERLGFLETPYVIKYMTWKPNEDRQILLCGEAGYIMEATLPDAEVRVYEQITTFKLEFAGKKELFVKKQSLARRTFPQEEDLASLDEDALKAAAQEETKDEDKDQEWIGEIKLIEDESVVPPTLTWAEYCEEGIWVMQSGLGALVMVKAGAKKVLKYAPIPDAWFDTFTFVKFICEGRYLLLGAFNGYIRVVRMPTEEEDNPDLHFLKFIQNQQILKRKLKGRRLKKEDVQPIPCIEFTDYYFLQMHDRYRGFISWMEFSADGKYMYTCGGDGNIFSYLINFEEPFFPPPKMPAEVELPKPTRVKEPSTLEGEVMSHEQLKQKEEYDKMMAIANAHKKRVRDDLAELTAEYNKLIKMNKLLPVSQQIDVTLDPRPLEVQEKQLEDLRKLAIRKVAHQLEASDIGLWKMYSRNIIQLDVFPFTLRAIRDPKIMIRPLRQKNLSQDFWSQLEEVHQKMAEAALRMKRTESTARRQAAKRPSWGPPRVASFLLGLPPKPPHPLKKQLRNYYERLNRHHLQFIEWQEHVYKKPDPNALPPGAAEALKEAEATIGNRLLKTDPDYVSPPGHNTQLRLCLTRQEIYETKRAFNVKVLDLREHKLRLVESTTKIGERLQEIRVEIPPDMIKPPPMIPTIDEEIEFPEKNLEVTPEHIEIVQKGSAQVSRRRGAVTEKRVSQIFPEARIRQPRVPTFMPLSETRPLAASWEILKPRSDQPCTPMEIEIRNRRIHRHLFEQDVLISEAEVAVQDFDSRLRQLQRQRIRVQENNQLMELHLYKMHQEMNVLNRFESHEDKLAEKVYNKLMQVKGVEEQIDDCKQRIEEHRAEKEQINYHCNDIQVQFKRLVQDNKFADFLRRIFKKKYRPPRDLDDDESSEEESSSSSSEEEEGSLDSRDIGPIRLDPNICPEGCEQDIYDKTYEMRNNRHKFEQDMQEQDRLVELLKKDIEAHLKVKRTLSLQLDKRKRNLKSFMLEKQNCLNEIEQVVVLRYDQMRARAVAGCTGPDGLSKAIVFPAEHLLKLRKRVLELQNEIKLARFRAKINRTHLFRMNIDLREMERLAEEIRAQMRDVLSKKLGKPRKVDKTLDDLLRQMARRHKYGLSLRILPHMLAQFRTWRERHSDLEQQYLKALDKYSNRLRVAAALQADVVPQRPTKEKNILKNDIEHFQRDVVRLRIIREQQIQEIKELEAEIARLKYKPQTEALKTWPVQSSEHRQSDIWLFDVPQPPLMRRHRYFPITPVASRHAVSTYDANVIHLLYDCLDSMRITRDDAELLLKDLTDELPNVISGEKSRYEIVDTLVRKWLSKRGGDPSQYKLQTRAFDALATLADRLIREHVHTLEGAVDESGNEAMQNIESALREVAQDKGANEPLHERLGPTLAALFHTAEFDDLATPETMTALVNSLLDPEQPFTKEDIHKIVVKNIVQDIQSLGVRVPPTDIERVVLLAKECLKAQLVSNEEASILEQAVNQAVTEAVQASAFVRPQEQRISQVRHSDEPKINRESLRTTRYSHTSIGSRTVLEGPLIEQRDSVVVAKRDSKLKTSSKTTTFETGASSAAATRDRASSETPQAVAATGAETGDTPSEGLAASEDEDGGPGSSSGAPEAKDD